MPSPDPAAPARHPDLLRRLSDERRTAFVLTQVVGLSYAEAAAVEEVPVGTIRSRVARARDELVTPSPRPRAGSVLPIIEGWTHLGFSATSPAFPGNLEGTTEPRDDRCRLTRA